MSTASKQSESSPSCTYEHGEWCLLLGRVVCGYCINQRLRMSTASKQSKSSATCTNEHGEDLELKENVAYITLAASKMIFFKQWFDLWDESTYHNSDNKDYIHVCSVTVFETVLLHDCSWLFLKVDSRHADSSIVCLQADVYEYQCKVSTAYTFVCMHT